MKKALYIMLVFITVFLTCSCTNKKTSDNNNNDDVVEEEVPKDSTTEEEKNTYVDDNPIMVGLYANINGSTTLIDKYSAPWYQYKDIIVFSTFYTQDKNLYPNYVAGTFDTYKANYTNIDNYRIGYNVKFTVTNGTTIDQTILNPTDANQVIYTSYLLVYAYDDLYHRNDNWYSHITEEEFNSSTMMTSFKVTGGQNYDQISSDIEITVFTYDSKDDFNENGKYRGKSSYTAILNKI